MCEGQHARQTLITFSLHALRPCRSPHSGARANHCRTLLLGRQEGGVDRTDIQHRATHLCGHAASFTSCDSFRCRVWLDKFNKRPRPDVRFPWLLFLVAQDDRLTLAELSLEELLKLVGADFARDTAYPARARGVRLYAEKSCRVAVAGELRGVDGRGLEDRLDDLDEPSRFWRYRFTRHMNVDVDHY